MKFKISRFKQVEETGRNYIELYLTDTESNSWESEITLRLTEGEFKRIFGNKMDVTTTLTLVTTEWYNLLEKGTQGLMSAVTHTTIKSKKK